MRIREATAHDIPALARTIVDSRQSAFRAYIPAANLVTFSYQESERNWTRTFNEFGTTAHSNKCIYVAEHDTGEIVGESMGGPERTNHPRYAGEVYLLYLLPAYHRQGIGRRLVETVVQRMLQDGLSTFLIRVLQLNVPARRFYEALGGKLIPDLHEQEVEDGFVLDQIAYGWTDARVALDRAAQLAHCPHCITHQQAP